MREKCGTSTRLYKCDIISKRYFFVYIAFAELLKHFFEYYITDVIFCGSFKIQNQVFYIRVGQIEYSVTRRKCFLYS